MAIATAQNFNVTGSKLNDDIFSAGTDSLVSNLLQGGQLGYGFKAGAFDAATPLAFPPAVIVVMQTPGMWDNLQDKGMLRQTVKAMFECHAKSVTGIDVNYTLETGEQPVGHDGQNLQVPTQSKRQAVTPSFTWPEVTGNLVWNIIKRWIYDINDPDTNTGLEHMGDAPAPFTMSTYALTFMALQFDQTMHPDRIIDASVITNVFPTTTGEMGIQREIGTTQVRERAVQFTGYLIHNDATRLLGREVARQLSLRSMDYHMAAANVNQISGDLFNQGRTDAGEAAIASDRDLTLKRGVKMDGTPVDDTDWVKANIKHPAKAAS